MRFDPEAKKFVGAFLVFAIFSAMTGFLVCYILAAVFVFLAGFSLFFLRDPERSSSERDSIIVSPADGRVVFSGETEDAKFGRVLKISVFMSILDVHINRAPTGGVVEKLEYEEGAFLDARKAESSFSNERQTIVIATDRGKLVVKQIAGFVARRIVCRLKEGQNISRGEKIGLIRFGSRLELLIPFDKASPIVRVGERVKCGETPVAEWL